MVFTKVILEGILKLKMLLKIPKIVKLSVHVFYGGCEHFEQCDG